VGIFAVEFSFGGYSPEGLGNGSPHWGLGDFIPQKLSPFPPLDNVRVMMIVWTLRGILSEQLCAGLCDTMFTVSSTLM